MKKIHFILFVVSVFWIVNGQSAVVIGLYEADVPVRDQSAESHKQGIRAALQEVLVKLTGDRNIAGRQVASYMLGQAEQYVLQYKYRHKPVIEDNQLSLEQQLFLWVHFNANAIDNELRHYGLPVWGKVRPATLVWLAIEDDKLRRLVNLDDESGYIRILENRAQERGIPLVYPLLDREDTANLKVTDIWGGFKEPVLRASRRYNANAILTGRIERLSDNLWEGQWSAYINEQGVSWQIQSEEPAQILTEGIDRLVDLLADHFLQATTYAQETNVEIVVNDINDFNEYSNVLHYLASLNSVVNVEVKSVNSDSVTFAVTTTGGELAVSKAIQLGNKLESLTGKGSPYRLLR